MKTKAVNKVSAIFAATIVMGAAVLPQSAIAAGSSGYGTQAVAPTIYSKNLWYSVAIPIVGAPPAGSTVTNVYYSYSFSSRPAGMLVYLCNNSGSTCFDITSTGSGGVNFTSYSVSATQPLKLYARVNGTGTMSPVYGNLSNFTVNYKW